MLFIEFYSYLNRSYAEMVSNVLSANISTAMDKHYLSSPQGQESLGKYVTLMVNLISQHSWKLPLEMINGWTKVRNVLECSGRNVLSLWFI